jgi:5'-nucleotidase
MTYDLSQQFVVGISSSALFDLKEEARIFREDGLQAFINYQREREDVNLSPGSAFPLIKGLLNFNIDPERPKVEVILMSRNHPDVSLRVFNSIDHHGLGISRASLTGGDPLEPYLQAFNVKLFLSQSAADVQAAANQGVAASLIYSPPPALETAPTQIRVAFDGDCVVFSDEAQRIFDRGGLSAFHEYEKANARKELPAGPFAPLLRFLSENQTVDPKKSPVRVALITDRNSPAHERAIRTLRRWNVRIDEAHFLGGVAKPNFLTAFRAHIFFDDKEEYCKAASVRVPTGQVFMPAPASASGEITVSLRTSDASSGESQFLVVCSKYLGGDFNESEAELSQWFKLKLASLSEGVRDDFLEELEGSALGTPKGKQRRSAAPKDQPKEKLRVFLDRLLAKHKARNLGSSND